MRRETSSCLHFYDFFGFFSHCFKSNKKKLAVTVILLCHSLYIARSLAKIF
jgi:hypothetical protein